MAVFLIFGGYEKCLVMRVLLRFFSATPQLTLITNIDEKDIPFDDGASASRGAWILNGQ